MLVRVVESKSRVIELDAQTLVEIPKAFEKWSQNNVFDDGSRDDILESHTFEIVHED